MKGMISGYEIALCPGPFQARINNNTIIDHTIEGNERTSLIRSIGNIIIFMYCYRYNII
jgi:hypothetical protein